MSSSAPQPQPRATSVEARVPWIAVGPKAQSVLELGRKVADTATTLLITGESGTGKDQLARWIHEQGSRHDAPFLKIDCASLPGELVESELFGHEKGAFTGAVAQKPGRLEMARAGTIVLDEVAALAPGIQSKLLRVLEEKRFERLGGTDTLRMDSRLIALTNADLQQAVAAGRFREDLFFRLNVFVIPVPPLRERREDIAALAAHFLAVFAVVHGRSAMQLDESAARLLAEYEWPGNIRELKNAVEHAVIFASGAELQAANFPQILQSAHEGRTPLSGLRSLEELEKDAISATLEATHYKITRSADILGITRKTLLEKRKKYGLIEPK